MLLELGNASTKARPFPGTEKDLRVTYVTIDDSYASEAVGDVAGLKAAVVKAHDPYGDQDRYGITRMEDETGEKHEAYLAVVHPGGLWRFHSDTAPTYVYSDNEVLAQQLSEHFQCPAERPDDLEERYWTRFGLKSLAPGVVPNAAVDAEALFTNVGRTLFANAMGGGLVGLVGTGTSATSTTLTSGSVATVTANYFAGMRIYVYNGTNIVWGNIISHTAGTTPVYTVDRWYLEGGTSWTTTAATTPASGYYYVISGSAISNWFVGLTATTTAAAAGDTSLTGEITTASGGLVRKIAPFAITVATTPVTFTLTPVYTANGSDSLPVTVFAIGVFNSMTPGDTTDTMMWHTALNATATMAASGDQLTITEQVQGS
jgi:hypothetical protein